MTAPPFGDGAIAVDEQIGGYEEDAGLRLRKESPEEFLHHSVRLKRHAFSVADAAFDVEFVLDTAAVLQGGYNIINTFGPATVETIKFMRGFSGSFNNDVSMKDALTPVLDVLPSVPATGLAVLSGALVVLAKKTYDATQVERDFAYEEYVTARAIEEVATGDNGIDAEELLSSFIMKFDVRPDISKKNWHRKIDYYRPSLRILPIKPEFNQRVEERKAEIRARDIQEGVVVSFAGKPLEKVQKIAKNLKVGARQAASSIDPHLLTASSHFIKGEARRALLSSPRGGMGSYIRQFKQGLAHDFKSAVDDIKESGLLNTVMVMREGFKINRRLGKDSKKFEEVARGENWEDQAMRRRSFYAAVAETSHYDKPDHGKERAHQIMSPALSESYTPSYFDKRQVEKQRITDISSNIKQQFKTAKGFVYANSFMAINGIFGTLAFYHMNAENAISMSAAAACLNGVASYANTFMNIPPMLSIGSGLERQHTRYIVTAERALSSQSSVRDELRSTRSVITAINGNGTGAPLHAAPSNDP